MGMLKKWWQQLAASEETDTIDQQLKQEVQSVYIRYQPPESIHKDWERLRSLAEQTPQLAPLEENQGQDFSAQHSPAKSCCPEKQLLVLKITRSLYWLVYHGYFKWVFHLFFPEHTFRSQVSDHHLPWHAQYIDVTSTHLKSSIGLSPFNQNIQHSHNQ